MKILRLISAVLFIVAPALAQEQGTPIATPTRAGKVKPDGTTITVDSTGLIVAVGGAATNAIALLNGKGTNTVLTNATISNPYLSVSPQFANSNAPIYIFSTNVFPNSAGQHITITSGSEVATSTDGAFGGLVPGTQFEFPGNSGQFWLKRIVDANDAFVAQVDTGFDTIPFVSEVNTTNWRARPPVMLWSDDTVGNNYGPGSFGGILDDNGMMTVNGINDQGYYKMLNKTTGSQITVGMVPEANVGIGNGLEIFAVSGDPTNAAFFGGNSAAANFYVDLTAPNESLGVLPDGTLAIGSGSGLYGATYGGGLTNRHGSTIPLHSVMNTSNGFFTGSFSNSNFKIIEARGTTNPAVKINNTNIVLNGGGLHLSCSANSPFITSTDHALGGLTEGTQIVFVNDNNQLVITHPINDNLAVVASTALGYLSLNQSTETANTTWNIRPKSIRWTDDTIGSENTGGFMDENGELWFFGNGNQGTQYFLDPANGYCLTVGMMPEANVGLSAGATVLAIGGFVTNTVNHTGSAGPAGAFYVHGFAPSESLGVQPNGTVAVGPGAQYAAGAILEGFTNRHGNFISLWSSLRAVAGMTSGGTSTFTNGVESVNTNTTLTVGTTGITNTLAFNYRVMGFTGTSVVQTNLTSGLGFNRGTIVTPTDIVLQTNEFLKGTSCAAQGVQAL